MHVRTSLPLVALLSLVIAAPAAAQTARRPRVAILDVRALGVAPEKAALLSEIALTEASGIGGLEVIGRSDIQTMIGFEKEKQMLGCSDDSKCMTEIAGAMGVDWILVGSLGQLDALYRLDLKLIDARRSRISGRIGESIEGSQSRLVSTTQAAVHKLLDPIAAAAQQAQASRPSPRAAPPAEARLAEPPRRPDTEPTPRAADESSAAPAEEAGPAPVLGRRWAVEVRLGGDLLGGGSTEPAALDPAATAEADVAVLYRLAPRWSLHAIGGTYGETKTITPTIGGDATLTLSGSRLSVGGAWAPRGNPYFSIAADVGVAWLKAIGTLPGARDTQRRTGLLAGLELRLDYPFNERWYVGARLGSRIALVGFDLIVRSPYQTIRLENDVAFNSLALAGGFRF